MMTRTALLVSLAFLFAACANNSDSNSEPGKSEDQIIQEEIQKIESFPSADDYSKLIPANSYQIAQAHLNYTEEMDFLTIGCKTPGTYGTDYKVEPTLKAGDQFHFENGSHFLIKPKSYTSAVHSIQNATANSVTFGTTFSALSFEGSPFSSLDQVFAGTPHVTSTVSYQFKPDTFPEMNFNITMNLTPEATQWAQQAVQNPEADWSCDIDYDSGLSHTYEAHKINYPFQGRNLLAKLEKRQDRGQIKCRRSSRSTDGDSPSVLLGSGTVRKTAIYSNEILSQTLMICGGSELYSSKTVTLDSGKIIESEAYKTISAPLR